MTCKHNRIGRVLTFEHRAVLTTYSIPNIGARFGVPVPRLVWFPIHANGSFDKRTIFTGFFQFPKLLQGRLLSVSDFYAFNVMVHNMSNNDFCHVFYICYCNTLSNVNVRRQGMNLLTSCFVIGNSLVSRLRLQRYALFTTPQNI